MVPRKGQLGANGLSDTKSGAVLLAKVLTKGLHCSNALLPAREPAEATKTAQGPTPRPKGAPTI